METSPKTFRYSFLLFKYCERLKYWIFRSDICDLEYLFGYVWFIKYRITIFSHEKKYNVFLSVDVAENDLVSSGEKKMEIIFIFRIKYFDKIFKVKKKRNSKNLIPIRID